MIIKLFIQYHIPLRKKYQDLYNITKDLDYYNFIQLDAYKDIQDNFINSIQYKDNIGDNISSKNYCYSDVTALYWYWKNIQCDIIGNNHYSKYFCNQSQDGLITKEEIYNYLKEYDFLIHIGTLEGRTVYQIYNDFHGHTSLDICGDVIKKLTPEYYKDFEDVVNGEDSSLFNMMICRKDNFDKYCTWLFQIMFECEKYIELPMDDTFQRRVFGALSERMLLVWLKHNNMRYYSDVPFAVGIDEALKYLCNNKEREANNG